MPNTQPEKNATELFRERVSQMPSEEMGDAAVAGFEKLAKDRAEGRPRLLSPDEEKATEAEAQERLATEAALKEEAEEEAAAREEKKETSATGEQDAGEEEVAEAEGAEGAEGAEVDDDEDPEIDIGNGQTMRFSELVKSGMRQADYTRKTQELAEQRRQFEQEREAGRMNLAQASQRLDQMVQVFNARLNNPQAQKELEELRRTDPAEYSARVTEIQQHQRMIQAAQEEQQRIYNEMRTAEIPRQRFLLGEVLPEFKGDNFDAAYKITGEYALGSGGLTPEEWSQLSDHRHVAIVEKARRYDELTRKTKNLPKKLSKLPRSIRPAAAAEALPRGHAAEQGVRDALAHQRASGGDIRSTESAFLALERRRRGAR